MDIKQHIEQSVRKIEKRNVNSTEKYKRSLLDRLQSDLDKATDKEKAVKDSAGLIARYKSAQPKLLTQMQEALQRATE